MKAGASGLVIDACLAITWFIGDEPPPADAEAALDFVSKSGAFVPGNFHSEVSHALLRAERRGRIDASASSAALAEILALPITVEMPDPQLVLTVSRERHLTCYDGSYLALAVQAQVPLASADANLREAARLLKVNWTRR